MTLYTACVFVCWQDIDNQQTGGLEAFPAAQSGPGYMYWVKMWCRAGFICTPAQSVGGVNTTLLKQGRGQLYDIMPIWFCWIKTQQTLLLTDLSVTINDEVKRLKFGPQKTQKQLDTISHLRNHLRKLVFFYSLLFLIHYTLRNKMCC